MYRRPPSLRKNRGNGNTIIVGDSQMSLLSISSGGGGTSVHRLSLICPGMWLFPAMPGGRVLPVWWPIRRGSARNPGEVLKKYLYGEAPPRGPTPYPSRKRSIFVTDSYFMTVRFQQLKGIQSSKQGMWKEYHLSIEGTVPPAPPGLPCQYDSGPIS